MKMRQGVSFPFHFLKYINEEEVDKLPPEINGSRKYKIKATISNYTELVKDRRWFKMSRSTVADPQTLRKAGKCGGSFVCNNKTCSFLSTQGEKNTSKFLFSSGVIVCHSCGNCATSTPCYARKLVDFREKEGYVYVCHIGRHTCTPKVDRKKYYVLIRKEIQKNTALPPKKLKLKLIKEKVGEQKFVEAKEVATIFSDTRRVKRLRTQVLTEGDALPPNCMEAVAKVKSGSDEHDPMHIYKINSASMNPDYPNFVFKTSELIMEIALQMDQCGEENALKDEMSFFNGAHSRVTGFVALAAWVLHPSIRHLFSLASMEVLSESSQTVKMFWDLFYECLQKVRAKVANKKDIDTSYKFNPKGFMCDESRANFRGLEAAFGKETVIHKVKTWQWHFEHQAREKAKVKGEFEKELLQICNEMCCVTTVDQYESRLNRLLEVGDMYPPFLPFFHWWDARRYHVFKVLRDFNLPDVNCAEIGNAAWKRKGQISLVEVANNDITTMLVQEVEYLNFKRNDTPPPVVAGPTDQKKLAKSYKTQMAAAEGIADMLSIKSKIGSTLKELTNPEHFIPNNKDLYKCEKKTKSKGRKPDRFDSLSVASKLKEAKRIMGESPKACVEYPILGSSREPRPTRPIKGTPFNLNYSHVTFMSGLGVSKCQGCPAPIQKLPPPMDLVFRFRCIRPYPNKKRDLWKDTITNGYCHLDATCLKSHNPDFELEHVRMEDKTFVACTPGHLEFLNTVGLLGHIISNKRGK